MANCTVLDWQGKESGQVNLDLKVAKDSTAVDLMQSICIAIGRRL